jgi:hypothetical protein
MLEYKKLLKIILKIISNSKVIFYNESVFCYKTMSIFVDTNYVVMYYCTMFHSKFNFDWQDENDWNMTFPNTFDTQRKRKKRTILQNTNILKFAHDNNCMLNTCYEFLNIQKTLTKAHVLKVDVDQLNKIHFFSNIYSSRYYISSTEINMNNITHLSHTINTWITTDISQLYHVKFCYDCKFFQI